MAVRAAAIPRFVLLLAVAFLSSCQSSTPVPTVRASGSAAGVPTESIPPPRSPWGPLAVIPPQDGSDTGLAVGTLLITDRCVYLMSAGEKSLLVWPADRTKWMADRREISFSNSDGTVVVASDGLFVNLGGGGDNAAESGLSGKEWASRMVWIAPPDPSCSAEVRWGVGVMKR